MIIMIIIIIIMIIIVMIIILIIIVIINIFVREGAIYESCQLLINKPWCGSRYMLRSSLLGLLPTSHMRKQKKCWQPCPFKAGATLRKIISSGTVVVPNIAQYSSPNMEFPNDSSCITMKFLFGVHSIVSNCCLLTYSQSIPM